MVLKLVIKAMATMPCSSQKLLNVGKAPERWQAPPCPGLPSDCAGARLVVWPKLNNG
jgi:hypothetical protein